MSQTGFTPILIYGSTTTGNTPSASNLTTSSNGVELAINATDGKLFYKDNGGTVQVLATKGTGTIGGSNTQVQYNSSGALAGSSNLTFDGTTLTANTLSVSTSTTTPIVQSSGSLLLKTNGTTTAVTIDTSQRVGVGTSSPSTALTVNGALSSIGASSLYGIYRRDTNAYVGGWYSVAGTITLDSAVGAALNIDSSGNLGLGVTPSAWNSGYRALDISSVGSVTSGSTFFTLYNNLYSGANVTYKTTGYATVYRQGQDNGQHAWFVAPSGTAGTTATLTQAMTLDNSGNLLVGTTSTLGAGVVISPSASTPLVGVTGSASSGGSTYTLYSTGASAYRFYVDFGGTIHATSIVITAISDQRLKENVRDIDTGLSSIMALKPRRFDWKEGKGQDKKNAAGFIAQEFETVFPECVSTSKAGEDGIEYKNINHETLIPTLVKAIQEQQALIESLTKRLAAAGIA